MYLYNDTAVKRHKKASKKVEPARLLHSTGMNESSSISLFSLVMVPSEATESMNVLQSGVLATELEYFTAPSASLQTEPALALGQNMVPVRALYTKIVRRSIIGRVGSKGTSLHFRNIHGRYCLNDAASLQQGNLHSQLYCFGMYISATGSKTGDWQS